MPHGVLFRGNREADIRRNLIQRGLIKGIIGLPANLFYGTGIPACILVLDKETTHARTGIFMIDASRGFFKDGNKNRLRSQDIHHKYGSAYSAFEFAARPQTPVLLNEHYRCHPHIARWFNRTFYKGGLTVLTDVSDTSRRDRAICWVDLDGAATQPAAGSWFNRAEALSSPKALRSSNTRTSSGPTLGCTAAINALACQLDHPAGAGQNQCDGKYFSTSCSGDKATHR